LLLSSRLPPPLPPKPPPREALKIFCCVNSLLCSFNAFNSSKAASPDAFANLNLPLEFASAALFKALLALSVFNPASFA
jgi:hypothetical protein